MRAFPPRSHHGYVPLAGRLPASGTAGSAAPDVWFLGGFGSRGLVHHALLGRATARAVLRRDEGALPEHARRMEKKLGACAPRSAA